MNSPTTSTHTSSAAHSAASDKQTPTSILILGCGVWIVSQLSATSSDLVSAVLAAGPLIVVPLATDLFGPVDSGSGGFFRQRRGRMWMLLAASLFAVAVGLPAGSLSAALAAPWTATACLFAATSFRRLMANRDASSAAIGTFAAQLFLAVGGVWAIASCAGGMPGGFQEPIVRLTAVHFHYAGFALPAIAVRVAAVYRKRAVDTVVLAVVVGVPLVAIGIAARSTTAELAATLFLGTAATTLAALQLKVAFAETARNAASLLAISSIALATSMALAAVYAFGRFTGSPILDIPSMIATHGMLNAVGFALCGLIGWRFHDRAMRR